MKPIAVFRGGSKMDDSLLFFAGPVNLDNARESTRIVIWRWLGFRTRVETTPCILL
jgi:hypothetical protein